jgi:hypothetical protein
MPADRLKHGQRTAQIVGGTAANARLLLTFPKHVSPAKVAEEIKKRSSKRLKEPGEHFHGAGPAA